jgi:hypothetical protein
VSDGPSRQDGIKGSEKTADVRDVRESLPCYAADLPSAAPDPRRGQRAHHQRRQQRSRSITVREHRLLAQNPAMYEPVTVEAALNSCYGQLLTAIGMAACTLTERFSSAQLPRPASNPRTGSAGHLSLDPPREFA